MSNTENQTQDTNQFGSADLLAEKNTVRGMFTTSYKTERPPTDSELIHALRDSMTVIFEQFKNEFLAEGSRQLDISITAKEGKVNLQYGTGEIQG